MYGWQSVDKRHDRCRMIYEMRQSGVALQTISKTFGTSRERAYQLAARGRRRKDIEDFNKEAHAAGCVWVG